MSEDTKTMKKTLFHQPASAWDAGCDREAVYHYADEYIAFLNRSKTEREAVCEAIRLAETNGYRAYRLGDPIEKGGRYYYNNRGKSVFLFRAGSEPLEKGIAITAAHIDSPRLDLKPRPAYEDSGLGYLKTHYYGGIKKYQWTTIPLALHGVAVREDGTTVEINIGEDPDDPVFYISDLLPHLGKDQMARSMSEGITAEMLNLIAASIPFGEDSGESDRVKLTLLALLHEKYGLCEDDLISAELCAVPAIEARYVGLDRGLIGGYGHDDRICAYTAMTAMFDSDNDEKTAMLILADKEETGSQGNTGMQSCIFEDLVNALSAAYGADPARVRAASVCLSADVAAGIDPSFGEVYERRNNPTVGSGIVICKYTGARGKSSTSDASAELVGRLRTLFAREGIVWQPGEMGKTDQGGGGTVAAYLSVRNVDVLDMGVALLSMHAPWELASVADLYMTYKAFLAFYRDRT